MPPKKHSVPMIERLAALTIKNKIAQKRKIKEIEKKEQKKEKEKGERKEKQNH